MKYSGLKVEAGGSKRVGAARQWAFDVPGGAWIIKDSLRTLKEMDSFRTNRKQFIERMDGECGATTSNLRPTRFECPKRC
jgi:hypothetical protein